MIPSALAGQLQQGLADFLRFSFWSSTPGMEHVIDDLLAEPGGLLKGPYISIKLPFVAGKNPRESFVARDENSATSRLNDLHGTGVG